MMFLLVGLGNPGLDYSTTRHNIGFMFTDYLVHDHAFPEFKSKMNSLYSDKLINGAKVIIQKPQTFMNLSGNAVAEIVSFFKIKTENVFVVHDDIDIDPFKVKIKFSGRSGGHNGLRDINRAIGKNYWQIRIGVGRPVLKDQVADYVLSSFHKDDLARIFCQVFSNISKLIVELLFEEEKTNVINKILKAVSET